ncbi:hypothetical protein SVIOM74S_02191 [Streptomyces violarus]
MEHEVAAEDKPAVGAVVADVLGAVLVDDDVPHLGALSGTEAQAPGPFGEDGGGVFQRGGPGRAGRSAVGVSAVARAAAVVAARAYGRIRLMGLLELVTLRVTKIQGGVDMPGPG